MTQNDKRSIGSHGLEAAPLGLGCMGMSEFYGTADEGEAVRTIHRALELGVTLLDTADMYGPFTNEKLVGRAVREWGGERPLIATKFGNVRGENGEFLGIRGDAEYVRNACEASLQRLGVDTIDLYYQHRVDPEVPIEETVGAMAELVQEGKVRYLGLSEAGAETIRKAVEVHPISALQTRVLAVGALGRGGDPPDDPRARHRLRRLLAARPRLPDRQDPLGRRPRGERRRRVRFPRFERANLEANLAVVEQVEAVAERHGATPGQVALAWVLSRGDDVIAIPGTKRVERVRGEPRRARARADRRRPRRARRARRRASPAAATRRRACRASGARGLGVAHGRACATSIHISQRPEADRRRRGSGTAGARRTRCGAGGDAAEHRRDPPPRPPIESSISGKMRGRSGASASPSSSDA